MYLTDQQVIDKLHEGETTIVILNYIDFASYIADRTARRCTTHERSDIRAEAYLALVEGVSNLKGHPNPRAFLREKIRGAVINFVRRKHTITKSDHTERLTPWVIVEESDFEEDIKVPPNMWAPFDRGELQENDLIENFLLSEIERKLIKLKIDGYTHEEIASLCQMPYSQIQRILQGTKSRVVKILNGDY